MNYTSISLETAEGVGLIRLNRPESGNAITLEMARELLDAVGRCDGDRLTRAVVLTGSGKMFCAGGDLKSFADQGDNVGHHLREVTHFFHGAISRLNWMDAPVIAAINGTAAGGGLSLALATDLGIAAESARFTMAYTKTGLAPDGASSYFLARAVGLRRAKELALLNRALSAEEAREWGLVNQVVPDDQVLPEALRLAGLLAAGPTQAFGETKRLTLFGATGDLESQMERESQAIAAMAGTPDGREGVAAFLGKRNPDFKGE